MISKARDVVVAVGHLQRPERDIFFFAVTFDKNITQLTLKLVALMSFRLFVFQSLAISVKHSTEYDTSLSRAR